MSGHDQAKEYVSAGETESPWQHFREVQHAMDRLMERSACPGASGRPSRARPTPPGARSDSGRAGSRTER